MSMLDILNELEPFQIFLIVSLFVVLIVGPLNMRRMKKKQEEELAAMEASSNGTVSDDEKPLKSYIENYKSSYSKEAIISALVNNGTEKKRAEELVEKYY